jgi:MFS superfamily sulfate permease-like transporter
MNESSGRADSLSKTSSKRDARIADPGLSWIGKSSIRVAGQVMSHAFTANAAQSPTPRTGWAGFRENWRFDLLSGFLVFLIALPLCLAIAKASMAPPIAGLWTAVIGGLVTVFLSNSELTIKGPAAGMIVIVAECVTEFSHHAPAGLSEHDALFAGYRLALGIGVASGFIQVVFGLLRFGKLSDFFPLAAVHGMLASIGVIIIAKQAYVALGVDAPKDLTPLGLLLQLPRSLPGLNPEIALIGLISLVILFGLPWIPGRLARRIPGPMLALLVAIPLGRYFDLEHQHSYLFPNAFFGSGDPTVYSVGPRFLVDMPEVLANPASAFALPDFSGVLTLTGLKFLLMFSLVGSLESLLSAQAIDLLDPWRRKTNFDRDLLAVGVANMMAASIGGLPMISEIVRSSANIANGGRTRWANFFHGACVLGFTLMLPNLIHQIPTAALAAMLIYTGFRLASPREFVATYRVGSEQLVVFLTTMLVTLTTDLLLGIAAGVVVKFVLHLFHGVSLRGAIRPIVRVEELPHGTTLVEVEESAMFTNWIGLRSRLEPLARNGGEVVVDLSRTRLVDHTVMGKLTDLAREFASAGTQLRIVGLDGHRAASNHPQASRRRKQPGQEPTT